MGLLFFKPSRLLPFFTLLAAFSGCAQKPAVQDSISVVSPAPTPVPHWDTNSVGRTKLDARFRQVLRLANLSPFDVRLEGTHSHPVLVGQVSSPELKASLEGVLLALKQVQQVSNKLEVESPALATTVPAPRGTPWGFLVAGALAVLWLLTLRSLRRAKAQLARQRGQEQILDSEALPTRISKAS
jgi:hypothetical protein